MKKWAQDMVKAFQQCKREKVLKLLNLGFPTETTLTIKDESEENQLYQTCCTHLACEYGFLEVLEELVSRGANLESLDSFKRTPLMISCESGQVDIMKYLTIVCKVSLKGYDYAGHTILHIAAINGKLEILKFLVEELYYPIKTLTLYKKTALVVCKELYALDFNPTIEKTLTYLIIKQNQKHLHTIPEEKPKKNSNSPLNRHEYCKENYTQSLAATNVGLKVRFQSQGRFDIFAFRRSPVLKSKFKVPSPLTSSVDKLASLKCDQVYRKIAQESSLMPSISQKKINRTNQTTNSIFSVSSISSVIPHKKDSSKTA